METKDRIDLLEERVRKLEKANIVETKDLRVGDIVSYTTDTGGGFRQWRVVKLENWLAHLHRPFVNVDGELKVETGVWDFRGKFQWQLIERNYF